jgi:DNA-binding NarL/FixJ family response regulator
MNIGLGADRRTILLVDADPHARAGLRKALEAARFSVGEAASAAEGERTARRIRPDAILAELSHDDEAGPGPTLTQRLAAIAADTPCYILSAAADALAGSVGLHELGVAGVFLKPVDTSLVIRVLRTRLGVGQGEDRHA